jgi:small subunit ribosomal protein S15
MARMHSGARGKSGSKKPTAPVKPTWVTIEKDELELLIVKMAKEGKSSAQIGLVLRDSYGVPSAKQILGQTIYSYLKQKKVQRKFPEDLQALMQKSYTLRKHVSSNGQDKTAKRGIILTDSKINRLIKYYKKAGVIDVEFRYSPKDLNKYLE